MAEIFELSASFIWQPIVQMKKRLPLGAMRDGETAGCTGCNEMTGACLSTETPEAWRSDKTRTKPATPAERQLTILHQNVKPLSVTLSPNAIAGAERSRLTAGDVHAK
jgi:hypothetical protein